MLALGQPRWHTGTSQHSSANIPELLLPLPQHSLQSPCWDLHPLPAITAMQISASLAKNSINSPKPFPAPVQWECGQARPFTPALAPFCVLNSSNASAGG